jgi:hypothetical protein
VPTLRSSCGRTVDAAARAFGLAVTIRAGTGGALSASGNACAIAAVRSTAATPMRYAAAGSGRLRPVAASSGTGSASTSAMALFWHATAASDLPPAWPVSHVSVWRT